MKLLRSLSFFLPLFISGCLFEKENAEPLVIFPLALGNTWIYVDSNYYGNDSITTSWTETSIIGTKEVTLDGSPQTVFLANSHEVGAAPAAFSNYVLNVGQSNYNCGAELETARVTGKSLHLEYPTQNGRRYATTFYNFTVAMGVLLPALDTIDIEVIETRGTCTVPAGTFACVHYRGFRRDGTVYADAFHAPGVGYLGFEITRRAPVEDSLREIRSVRRLVSYTLH
jgi:hypothetical protein